MTAQVEKAFDVTKIPAFLTIRLNAVMADMQKLADAESDGDKQLAIIDSVEAKMREQIVKFDHAHKTNFIEHADEITDNVMATVIAAGMAA